MKKNKETDWAQVINWVITIVLIAVILLAVHQRVFEAEKCKSWCAENIKEVMVKYHYSDGSIANVKIEPDWDNIFAENISNFNANQEKLAEINSANYENG